MCMDPNTALDTVKEGTKALNKFQDILSKVFGPKWTIKQADADAYADQKKIEMIRDNPDMDISYEGGIINVREKTADELIEYRAQQRMLADAVRQEQNIERVISIASKELETNDIVSDNPIEEDWVVRFFEIAKDISNKEMQDIWGKILAGEVKQPHSFSMRTLELIRNITKWEAEKFQSVIPLVLKGGNIHYILAEDYIFNKYNVNYEDLLILDECGLLNTGGFQNYNITIKQSGVNISYNDYVTIAGYAQEDNYEETNFRIYTLTSTGRELYRILNHENNLDYVYDVAEYIFEKVSIKAKISVCKITNITDENVIFESTPIKVFMKE